MSRVKLHFRVDDLSIVGEGRGSHESSNKGEACRYARKKATTDALKCAFTGVAVVLLPGGKRTVHLLPRSVNYWLPNSADNTDDTNFAQPSEELIGRPVSCTGGE